MGYRFVRPGTQGEIASKSQCCHFHRTCYTDRVTETAVPPDRLRSIVRTAVAARVAVDDREAASIDAFLVAFDALDEPFSREHDPVHVTGSGFVVGPRGIVLLKHKRLGFWMQPGGHIDAGETPWEAARRECVEETGLDVRFLGPFDAAGVPELVHVDVHAGGRGHTHLDLRYLFDGGVAEGGSADPAPPAGESQEIGWFDWPAAIAIADDGLRGALTALRDRDSP